MRINLGYFVRPAVETGTGMPRVEPVLGYLVRRDEGILLFDTGMSVGSDEDLERHYRPRIRALPVALAASGVEPADVSLVVNCHLHFDHCGGNTLLPRTPILVQGAELAAARGPDYTLPELVDFPGVTYRELNGEAEIWPGVWVIPTPGHTAGHQSLVVRQPDGTVILAGQAHDFATGFGGDQLARRAAGDGMDEPLPAYQPWLARLMEFDPRRVLFAHDNAVWEPAGE